MSMLLLFSQCFNSFYKPSKSTDYPKNVENVDWLIEPQYEYAGSFRYGLARIHINTHFGMINKANRIILYSKKYISIDVSKNGDTIITQTSSKIGSLLSYTVNHTKKNRWKPQNVNYEINQTAGLKLISDWDSVRYNYSYLDLSGNVTVPIGTYDYASPFSESLAAVGNNNKVGFIDVKGNLVIPLQYHRTLMFSEGYCPVILEENSGWIFIDKTGKIMIDAIFDEIDWNGFSEGLCCVKLKNNPKWGYIDKTGKLIIPAVFDGGGIFSENVAPVKVGTKWGYINNPLKK